MVSTAAGGVSRPARSESVSAAAGGRRAPQAKSARRRRQPMGEVFYTLVVLASVLLFIALATGVGILALQSSLR
jgi:hypothetical protein